MNVMSKFVAEQLWLDREAINQELLEELQKRMKASCVIYVTDLGVLNINVPEKVEQAIMQTNIKEQEKTRMK